MLQAQNQQTEFHQQRRSLRGILLWLYNCYVLMIIRLTMKQFLHDLKTNAENFLQCETSTKDRSPVFRGVVVSLILLTVAYIIFNILKNIA